MYDSVGMAECVLTLSLCRSAPSAETLAARAAMPAPSALPVLTIAELAKHGKTAEADESMAVYTRSIGFVFEYKSNFQVLEN